VSSNGGTIEWRGDFRVDSFISSSHWKMTSYFDNDLKLIRQVFEQKALEFEGESCGPPISWKDL